jgi:hypothetical protein
MARRRLTALALLAGLGVAACAPGPATPEAEGRALLERARAAHGAPALDRAEVSFTFRGEPYRAEREGGRFVYTRVHGDSLDRLDNDGLSRTVHGQPVPLAERDRQRAETALNSVVYFALLPYNLADPAVQARALGSDTLRGEPYRLVEVSFGEDGGGRDWEDTFVYWVHADRHTVDFLAYDFHTGEGGTRFREATNPREVGGFRFQDYLNYTADPTPPARLAEYGRQWEAGALTLVSEVRLDSLRVEPQAGGR